MAANLKLMLAFSLLLCLGGCDSVERYKFMSTVFDGYPALPPPEEYCRVYIEGKCAEEDKVGAGQGETVGGNGQEEASKHKPYAEKKCNDCHDQTKPDGLVLPVRELCFKCHVNFIRGAQVHGPVAVGDCMACHLPHSSPNHSLLKFPKNETCSACHQEERLTPGMHDRVTEKGMVCVDCHDPHFGDAHYFLQ
jgi:predicted CXXCH cytochrome family protein